MLIIFFYSIIRLSLCLKSNVCVDINSININCIFELNAGEKIQAIECIFNKLNTCIDIGKCYTGPVHSNTNLSIYTKYYLNYL